MSIKLGVSSKELFKTINELMRSEAKVGEKPVILSCGGIYLQWRRISRKMASWHPKIFLPNARQNEIRVFRVKGQTVQGALERVMEMGSLN